MKTNIDELKVEGSQPVFIDDKIDSLILKDDTYKAKFTKFLNCEFEGTFNLQNVNLSHGLEFLDCKFNFGALFNNVLVEKFDHLLQNDSVSITFKNCTFENKVSFIGNSKIERSLLFDDCTFKKGLEIYFLNIITEGLSINDCTVYEKLDVFNCLFKRGISISNNAINTFLRIVGVNGSSISFVSNNVVSGNLHVDNCQLEDSIIFNDGTFKDDVKFSLVKTRNSGLSIIGSTFEKSFTIDYHHNKTKPSRGISKFYLSECKFQNGLYVNGTQNGFFIEYPLVEEIRFNTTAKLTGDIFFKDLNVGVVKLEGFNSSANIVLRNLVINEFEIKSFINNAGLILSNIKASTEEWLKKDDNSIKINSSINIKESNLGKAQFYEFDFQSFNIVNIKNTILVDISTSLIKWFDEDNLNKERFLFVKTKPRKEKKDSVNKLIDKAVDYQISGLSTNKEIFRQLKFIAQKQGDLPQSLAFQRIEMRYYRKIIKLEKSWWRSESLILWSNHWSNDFGRSWLIALVWLLGLSFLIYMPIGLITSEFIDSTRFASSWAEVKVNLRVIFSDNIKQWFVILNPTHRIKELNENITSFSNWIYFLDICSRIIVSYFIFQMVYAFRKFNR